MMDDGFLGIILVVRQASSQAHVVLRVGSVLNATADSLCGIGLVEFAKFAIPAAWLMNRKLDFEIGNCGPSISAHRGDMTTPERPIDATDFRFVSFPCDCVTQPAAVPAEETDVPDEPLSMVTAFNVVFMFDARRIDDDQAELYWQCISTLSRAIIQEEERCFYLSRQVSLISSHTSANSLRNSLHQLLDDAYNGLCSAERGVSLYVNNSILTHIGVIPFGSAPLPPHGYQSLLLTCDNDTLQTKLPVDSASNVRRLIDAADPTKTIKEHMIELGLPVSTIQRISQHLVYWKKAKIVPTLNKRTVLILNPAHVPGSPGIAPTPSLISAFAARYNIRSIPLARSIYFKLISLFSGNKNLSDVKEIVSAELPQLISKFNDLCTFLLSNRILTFSESFYRYFPGGAGQPAKRHPPGMMGRPKFQNTLPAEIRSQFSPYEFDVIFEKLKFNPVGAEMMIRLISNYVKPHKDLMTARIELNERYRCTTEEFLKYTECLLGEHQASVDSLLVKYECDAS